MRIDCSKTLNYVAEKKRMCDFYPGNGWCEACPMYEVKDCHNAEKITQEHINIVQKWSDEHPQETMADRFFKMFPNAKTGSDGMPVLCPQYIGWGNQERCPKVDGKVESCTECWNRPYKEVGAGNG